MPARLSSSFSGFQPVLTGSTISDTVPECVNLKALDSRFLMTCCKRLASVNMARGSRGSSRIMKSTFLDSATWRKVRST